MAAAEGSKPSSIPWMPGASPLLQQYQAVFGVNTLKWAPPAEVVRNHVGRRALRRYLASDEHPVGLVLARVLGEFIAPDARAARAALVCWQWHGVCAGPLERRTDLRHARSYLTDAKLAAALGGARSGAAARAPACARWRSPAARA